MVFVIVDKYSLIVINNGSRRYLFRGYVYLINHILHLKRSLLLVLLITNQSSLNLDLEVRSQGNQDLLSHLASSTHSSSLLMLESQTPPFIYSWFNLFIFWEGVKGCYGFG